MVYRFRFVGVNRIITTLCPPSQHSTHGSLMQLVFFPLILSMPISWRSLLKELYHRHSCPSSLVLGSLCLDHGCGLSGFRSASKNIYDIVFCSGKESLWDIALGGQRIAYFERSRCYRYVINFHTFCWSAKLKNGCDGQSAKYVGRQIAKAKAAKNLGLLENYVLKWQANLKDLVFCEKFLSHKKLQNIYIREVI